MGAVSRCARPPRTQREPPMNRLRTLLVVIAAVFALGACGDEAAGALFGRHAAACSRSGIPGGCAGQAGTLSRDLLRCAAGARTRRSRLPALRGSAEPHRQRACRHGKACRPRTFETTLDRRGGGRHRIRMLREMAAATRHRGEARAPIRIRHGAAQGRCAVEFREQCAPDP